MPPEPQPAPVRWSEAVPASFVVVGAVLTLIAPFPLAAVGAALFIVSAVRQPVPSLCCVILSLPVLPLPRAISRYSFSPTEIMIVLATFGALVRLMAVTVSSGIRSLHIRSAIVLVMATDPLIVALAGLMVIIAGLSLTNSVAVHESVQSFRLIIVEPIVFFALVITQARQRRDIVILFVALIVAGTMISVVGVSQYVSGDRIITAEAGLRRIRGFYGSPNNLALFLGRCLPCAIAAALWWRRGRWLWVAGATLMAVAILLTFSIGAFVAVALSLLLVMRLHSPRTFRFAVGSGLVAAGGGLGLALAVPRIGSHLSLQSGTNSIRLFVWQSALRMVVDHPIRGIGLDNFLTYYQHGYRFPEAWEEPALSHPHNIVLDFWLSLGLPGIILLGCLIVRFIEIVREEWGRTTPVGRGLYAGVAGAMADTILHGMVDNSFFLPDLAVLFWLMFAIVCLVRTQDSLVNPR